MIEFREVISSDKMYKRLQFRTIPVEIGYLKDEDKFILQPQKPIRVHIENMYTEWKDVDQINEIENPEVKLTEVGFDIMWQQVNGSTWSNKKEAELYKGLKEKLFGNRISNTGR